jgi:alkylation response protein AidB-like acyl-CoA dehydrogenase
MASTLEVKTDEALRQDVRDWLAANWTMKVADLNEFRTTPAYRDWLNKVVDARWAAPRWPVEWFGRALSDEQGYIIEQEFNRVGAPGSGMDRTQLYANTALAYGTEALKKTVIPGILRGEITMCLLYSEPGAGSDLAAVRTRAEPNGNGWTVNGQKIWTSTAATADYGMLIARTDWDKPKHQGLSFFFLPMKQQGVEVRPLRQITNESHFNEVFFTDAKIPAANLLGNLGDGWKVLQTALAYERSAMGERARGPRRAGGDADTNLIALARKSGKLADPAFRQELARTLAYRQLNALNTARAKAGLEQSSSSSIMSLGKLAMSRILHEEARLRTRMLGAESMLQGPEHPLADDANFLSLNAYFTSIGGGTDQIQRNIISERVLGMPKEQEVDRNIPFRAVQTEKRK